MKHWAANQTKLPVGHAFFDGGQFAQIGSAEEHFKYRNAVMEAYPCAHFPVFEGFNHMQYQIRDAKSFAEMLSSIIERDTLPALPFLKN